MVAKTWFPSIFDFAKSQSFVESSKLECFLKKMLRSFFYYSNNLCKTLLVSRAFLSNTLHSKPAAELQVHRSFHSSGAQLASDNDSDYQFDSDQFFTQFQKQNGSLLLAPHFLNRVISVCARSASLSLGEKAHCIIIKLGYESNVFIGTALVDMYSKCNRISSAKRLFDEMPGRNVVTCNSLIYGYSHVRFSNLAIELFTEMLKLGFTPTPFTISAVALACSQLEAEEVGAQVHCLSLKFGFSLNVFVGTALVDMYSKCSNVDYSRKCFDEMPERNVITWSSMMSGYAQNRQPCEAMLLVREMRRSGVRLNKVTYNSLLSSFSSPNDLDHGRQVHCQVVVEGLELDTYILVTLLTTYAECGCLEDFCKLSSMVFSRDQILWNSIIYGFSHLGKGGKALQCFVRMRQAGIDIDFFSLTSVLKAIRIVSALEKGKEIHALALKAGFASNVYVENGLVSMYAKCGVIDDSKQVFLSINEPDLVSWNSLISGCAQHGYAKEAIELFETMRKGGTRPDHSTFLSLLSACGHAGLLNKGLEYFSLMRDDDMMESPRVEHYACVVDLLGRAGHLSEAESFINCMPIKPGSSVYKALLSACRVHGDVDIAIRSANRLLELWPDDPASYVLLSSVLAEGGCWDGAEEIRKLMYDRGLWKQLGCSWIDGNKNGSAGEQAI